MSVVSKGTSESHRQIELEDLHAFLSDSGVSDRDAMFAALLERANDGIAIVQDTRLVYANDRLGELTDYPTQELIGKHIRDLVHPDEIGLVAERYRRRITGEEIQAVYESALQTRGGERVDIEVNAGVIPFRGSVADLVFVHDITERKRTEAALRRSEEEFRSVVQHLSDMVLVVDQDSRIKFETPSVSRVLGYSPGELIGKAGFDLIHPDDLPIVRKDLEDVVRKLNSGAPTEFRMRGADGDWVQVEAIGDNLLDVPAVQGLVITARDITARKTAEKKLQQLNAFNERIVQGVSEGIILQDADGLITFANPAAATILGYTPGELEGMFWRDIIPKDQHRKVKAAQERRRRGVSDRYELPMLCKDGRKITAWVSGSPRYQDGEYIGVMAVFLDITDLKDAELRSQRLLEQQVMVNRLALSLGNLTDLEAIYKITDEMVQSLMDADVFLVTLYDPVEHLIHASYTRAYGERLASNEFQFFSTEDTQGHFIQLSVLMEGKPIYVRDYLASLQVTRIPSDMQRRISPTHQHLLTMFEIYSRSVLAVPMNVAGETIGIMVIHSRRQDAYSPEDIDLFWALANMAAVAIQNARLLEQTRQSAERLQRILHTVPDGMLLLDAERRLVMTNPPAEEYLKVLSANPVGEAITHLGSRSLDDLLSEHLEGMWGEVEAGERIFELAARPMPQGAAEGGWVLVLRDVTREREVEKHIQEQERLATVGQLAAGIAHDFNNIISTIMLYSQMMAQSPGVTGQDRERVGTIYQQAMNATELIRQILDFSRRSVMERQPLSLRPLVKEQVRILERTLGGNIKVEVSGMNKRCVVFADPTRIQQVMMNLGVNARDAMPEGGTLTIGLDQIEVPVKGKPPLPEMQAGKWVRLSFADTGSGIDPKNLPHIFEPFFTTKSRGRGTGLGLPQVYGIVSQHEGFIDVKSEPGKGSIFVVYLPVFQGDLSGLPDLDTGPLEQGRQETILVVEDSAFTRQALVDSLEALNYCTMSASNGREALDLLLNRKGGIHLVVSDLIMPEMSGLALAREIEQQNLGIPMILLSGHAAGREIDVMRRNGLLEVIDKPPSLEALSEAVGKMLKK
jgi:two-component system cell cycle sensor histidine kinase/response regulator CckA